MLTQARISKQPLVQALMHSCILELIRSFSLAWRVVPWRNNNRGEDER